mmetsp:Transcript_112491/g.318953  ORF Transcript_112491/g.318953 Transcript_112491/m.318953 type:complete len:268 (-) Transcript_112491:87-890(-)
MAWESVRSVPQLPEAPSDGWRLEIYERVPFAGAGPEIAWHIAEVVRIQETSRIQRVNQHVRLAMRWHIAQHHRGDSLVVLAWGHLGHHGLGHACLATTAPASLHASRLLRAGRLLRLTGLVGRMGRAAFLGLPPGGAESAVVAELAVGVWVQLHRALPRAARGLRVLAAGRRGLALRLRPGARRARRPRRGGAGRVAALRLQLGLGVVVQQAEVEGRIPRVGLAALLRAQQRALGLEVVERRQAGLGVGERHRRGASGGSRRSTRLW